MRKISVPLVAAGLIGLAASATAAPANVGVGIHLGAPPVYAPPPAVVHYAPPVYVPPRAAHAVPVRNTHYVERAPRGHSIYGYARPHR